MKCPKCHFKNPAESDFCSKCGTQLSSSEKISISHTQTLETPLKELTRGSTLAERYEIIEELGKGGMGKVYKVLDKEIEEEVALKLLNPEIAADERTIKRFRNELKFARKITHKNVCRMHDLNKEEGTYFITMEYVPGEDLKSFIRRSGQLTVGKAVFIAKQVCEGLAEAHKLDVVHRDLKPQNIMIDKEGNTRIMDFGIARSAEAKGITGEGVIIGTPEYMSPEQVEGEEADQRSDIYSLGVILYEMVTGRVPFEGKTPLSIALKHKTASPREPKELNAQVPSDLNRVILRCMEKDGEQRYQSAEELLSELDKIEEGIPTAERVVPKRRAITPKEITVTLRLKKLLIPAIVIIALVIAGVVIWRFIPRKEVVLAPKIENSIAVITFKNQTGDSAYDYLRVAIPDLLITSLENSGNLHVATWERLRDLLKQMDKEDVEVIDEDLGFELCYREGIQAIVLGSFIKAGDMFATNVKVLDAESKELLKSVSFRGEGVDSILRTQIDEMSREISRGVGIPEQRIEDTKIRITDFTTNSMEAYNNFLKGREDYEKHYYDDARQSLEKAVELDPEFAVAYLYLGRSVRGRESREAYKKAKTYSERATEKERLYIEAAYASAVEGDPAKRFRILKQMAKEYPKEKRVYYELARYYRVKGLFDKAIEEYNKALELDPEYGSALNSLAFVYVSIEDFEKAIEYFKKYIAVSPKDANPLDSLALCYFWTGRLEEAVAKFKEALEIKPDWVASCWGLSYIYALKENYREAMRWADRAIDMAPSPDLKAKGFLLKGFFCSWLGRLEQSLEEIRKASDLTESIGYDWLKSIAVWAAGWVHYEIGELELARRFWKSSIDMIRPRADHKANNAMCFVAADLKEGRIDSAKSRLTEIKSLLPEIYRPEYRDFFKLGYDSLHAEVMLAEGSLEEATAMGKRLLPLKLPGHDLGFIVMHNLLFRRDVLARCYRQKGEKDKAIAEYEQLVTFYPESKRQSLIHPKYHYQLARLYEEKGWEGKAIDQYEKFLEIWKDADPSIVEVEDAKKRLSSLKK